MIKIPSLFKRDYEGDRHCYNEVVPGCEWVTEGLGVASRKWDGTACMIKDGLLYKRYDAKHGKQPPSGWMPCQDAPDSVTGHWPGWLQCHMGKPEDRWHYESIRNTPAIDGTYELVGPKIGGNAEGFSAHLLLRHGGVLLDNVPRDYDGIKQYLMDNPMEGIVSRIPSWQLYAKVKRRDFGLEWPLR